MTTETICLLLPYFSDDKTIFFFLQGASLVLSSVVFFVWTEIWICKHSLKWRNVFTTWGFFLFICPSLYRLDTCSLFFLLFMLSLLNDLIDNWTIANKFTQFIWISTFFSVFSWSYLWFYWMFLKQIERVVLRWQTFFSDAVIFRAKPLLMPFFW